MKKKLGAILLVVALAVSLGLVPAASVGASPGPYDKVEAAPGPGDNHFDVNFVTEGKIAFQSTFNGTTTPTVPPFYWHDDFEGGLGKWSQVVDPTGTIATVAGQGRASSTGVEVYQTSDSGDTVLYGSIYAPAPGQGRAIFWFYDNTTVTGTQVVDVLENAASLLYGGKALLIGINSGFSSNYVSRVYPGGWSDTGILRSTGWHKIEFVADGSTVEGYIDRDVNLDPIASTSTFGSFNFIEIGSYWSVSGAGLYYDDVTVLGPTGPGQSWVGDGPQYTETRTISGSVTGLVISGTLDVSSTTTLDVTTGTGTTTGDWTLTNGPDGFEGTLIATNTNFGLLSGSFVSTSATGIYAGQMVEGTFTGNFYESDPGVSGWDSFAATLTGLPNPGEVLVGKTGTYTIDFQTGSTFAILDSDAGVFDADAALVQIKAGLYYEIFDQARGKPKTNVTWHYMFNRVEGKPKWNAHYGPARGTGEPYNCRLEPPASWSTTLGNNGCTNLATRWYYYDSPLCASP